MGGIYSVPVCPLPNLFSKHPNSAANAILRTHQLGVIAIIRSGRVPCPSAAAIPRRRGGAATVPFGVRTAVPRWRADRVPQTLTGAPACAAR